jgi:hypothetical protein
MFLDCSHALPARPPTPFAGVTVADLDGDGIDELFISSAGPNRVLKWVGTAFRDTAPPALADHAHETLGCVAADFDGDGREELYLVNDGPATDRLFDCQPDGRWVDLFDRPAHRHARNPHATRAVAALDRRGHGRYGFAVTNHGRPLRLYELGPSDAVTDLAVPLGIAVPVLGGGTVVAPLASDRPDLYCVNELGANLLFRNTGMGTFLEVAAEHGLRDCHEHGRGGVPLDGGLVVCNRDGPHRLFARRPDGTYRNVATPAMALPSDVRTVVAADFDNDGWEELLFVNGAESPRFFRRSEDDVWSLADGGALADGAGAGAAVADVDQDGRLELVLTTTEAVRLFKWPDAGNNWLRVRPLTRFGAAARGAVVRLTAGRTQLRTICGGSGFRCQMEPVAHFGLGTADRVEAVQVTWPDDTTVTLERPAVNRTIVVRYPG